MIPIILALLVIALLSPHYRSHQARMEAIKQMHRASQEELESKYRKMVPFGNVQVDKASGRVRINPTRATRIVYYYRAIKHFVKKHPFQITGTVAVGIIIFYFIGLPLFPAIGANRYWVGGDGNISIPWMMPLLRLTIKELYGRYGSSSGGVIQIRSSRTARYQVSGSRGNSRSDFCELVIVTSFVL